MGVGTLVVDPITGITSVTPSGDSAFINKVLDDLGDFSDREIATEHDPFRYVRAFRAKIAAIVRGSAAQAKVAFIGDSVISQGSFTESLKTALTNTFGNSGVGWIASNSGIHVLPTGATVTAAGTWTAWDVGGTEENQPFGASNDSRTSSTNASTLTFSAPLATGFVLHYRKQAGGGTFTTTVDSGEASADVDTANATDDIGFITVSGLTGTTSHTIKVTVTSTDLPVTIYGVDVVTATTGVKLLNLGRSGTGTAQYVKLSQTTWGGALTAIAPDAIVFMLGINDSAITAAASAANVSTIIDKIRIALPNVDVLLVAPYATSYDVTYPGVSESRRDYYNEIAKSKGIGFVDLWSMAGGTYPMPNTLGLLSDGIHPTTIGGQLIANQFFSLLAGETTPWRGCFTTILVTAGTVSLKPTTGASTLTFSADDSSNQLIVNYTPSTQIANITANGTVNVQATTGLSLRYYSGAWVSMIAMTSVGVAIGSGTSPVASAILSLESTTKGLGLPAMTTAQKEAIASPAERLVVYDTDLHAPCWWNGSAWKTFAAVA